MSKTVLMDVNAESLPRGEQERCPSCGAGRTLIRVEHALLAAGGSYDRYFCASCCSSVEFHGGPGFSHR
jgi:uncharacterized protein (DUF983 family)